MTLGFEFNFSFAEMREKKSPYSSGTVESSIMSLRLKFAFLKIKEGTFSDSLNLESILFNMIV